MPEKRGCRAYGKQNQPWTDNGNDCNNVASLANSDAGHANNKAKQAAQRGSGMAIDATDNDRWPALGVAAESAKLYTPDRSFEIISAQFSYRQRPRPMIITGCVLARSKVRPNIVHRSISSIVYIRSWNSSTCAMLKD